MLRLLFPARNRYVTDGRASCKCQRRPSCWCDRYGEDFRIEPHTNPIPPASQKCQRRIQYRPAISCACSCEVCASLKVLLRWSLAPRGLLRLEAPNHSPTSATTASEAQIQVTPR